jgi:3-hydroxyisobutyrate dehydrogenase
MERLTKMVIGKIAFLGTGIMGAGMARNLLQTGYALTVYNRTAAKTEPLVKAGAVRAATPRAAVKGADLIIAIVGDDAASRQIWLGEEGVLAGNPNPNALTIESTTLSQAWVEELHHILAERGLRFIDSPVTGGRNGAEKGTLTLLVGAEETALAEARPVMEAYSHKIIHFGPPGAGTAYKLVVNLMVAVQATALAEGVLLAEKAGLDLAQVAEALASGAVGSPLVKAYAGRMARGEHDQVNFSARWMHKDATYALGLAAEKGQAMPTSSVAAQIFQMALSKGLADKNLSAVIEALR